MAGRASPSTSPTARSSHPGLRFDGDGRDDVFLATGRAWYVSYGVSEWRFLRASDRTLISLSLAELDGNGRTDVVARVGASWQVVWNGIGALETLAAAPFLPPQAFYTNAGELLGDVQPRRPARHAGLRPPRRPLLPHPRRTNRRDLHEPPADVKASPLEFLCAPMRPAKTEC
jgi:hypothetical protein